ncbi:MAG: oligosaccharide flippase family protein [Rhodothermia bacterium]|nr:oligosaccharide flippase family protein [Rhodothermia bacterium]
MNNEIKRAGFFENLTVLALGNIIVRPIWIIFSIYMSAEYLGKEGFGIFYFAIYFMSVMAEFADMGITNYANRELVRRPEFGSTLLTNILVVKAVSTLLIVLGVWLGAFIGNQSSLVQFSLVWAGVYTALFRHLEFLRSFFRAKKILRYESISMVLEKILVVLLGAVFLWAFMTPVAALFGMSLGMFFTFILVLYAIHAFISPIKRELFSVQLSHTIYQNALPIGLMGIFSMAYRYLGILVLYFLFGESVVGVYSLPLRIVETLQLIPVILGTTIFAYFTQAIHEDRLTDFKRMLNKSLVSMLIVGLAAVLAIWLGGYAIIKLFKPEFAAAEGLIKFLIWSYPVGCVNSILLLALMALDEQRFLAKTIGGITLFSIGFNVWVIDHFVIYGAIFASLLIDLILCIILLYRTYNKISTLKR